MDAVEFIKQNLNVEQLLNHYNFKEIRDDGEYIRSCCALHGGSNPTAFVINTENGLWSCHTGGCGNGDIFTLIQKMEGIGFKDSVVFASKFFNIDIENMEIRDRADVSHKELLKFTKAIKNNKKKIIEEYSFDDDIKEVAKYRSFRETTIDAFGLYYAETFGITKRNGDKSSVRKRLVFKVIFDGKLVAVLLRRTNSKDQPKWLNQPVNVDIGNILYNYDSVKREPEIVVCEGLTDVWAFHEIGIPAVATFSANVTKEQYKLLLKTGADLVFAYDGDEAGRKGTENAIEMFRNKANISTIQFNIDEDPESIDREELYRRYGERIKK